MREGRPHLLMDSPQLVPETHPIPEQRLAVLDTQLWSANLFQKERRRQERVRRFSGSRRGLRIIF